MSTFVLKKENFLEITGLAILFGWVCVFIAFFWAIPKALPGDYGYLGILSILLFVGIMSFISAYNISKKFSQTKGFWLLFLLSACLFAISTIVGINMFMVVLVVAILEVALMERFVRFLIWLVHLKNRRSEDGHIQRDR